MIRAVYDRGVCIVTVSGYDAIRLMSAARNEARGLRLWRDLQNINRIERIGGCLKISSPKVEMLFHSDPRLLRLCQGCQEVVLVVNR